MIYVFAGKDDYLKTEGAKTVIRETIPDEERDFGVETVNGACNKADDVLQAIDAVREALFTSGLFGGKKVIWLREANFLPGATGRAVEAQAAKEAAAAFCETLMATPLPEEHTLVITTSTFSKATRFAKWVAKVGKIVECGKELRSYQVLEAALERLEQLLPETSLKMSAPVKQAFAKRVGADSRTILSELTKLETYLLPPRPVTEEDIARITSITNTAEPFDLIDALHNRNALALSRLIALLRMDKDSAFPAAAVILNSFNDLCAIRDALQRGLLSPNGTWMLSPETLPARLAKLNGWAMKRLITAANHFTLNELRAARHYLVEMRFRLVDSSMANAWDIMEPYLLRAIAKR